MISIPELYSCLWEWPSPCSGLLSSDFGLRSSETPSSYRQRLGLQFTLIVPYLWEQVGLCIKQGCYKKLAFNSRMNDIYIREGPTSSNLSSPSLLLCVKQMRNNNSNFLFGAHLMGMRRKYLLFVPRMMYVLWIRCIPGTRLAYYHLKYNEPKQHLPFSQLWVLRHTHS